MNIWHVPPQKNTFPHIICILGSHSRKNFESCFFANIARHSVSFPAFCVWFGGHVARHVPMLRNMLAFILQWEKQNNQNQHVPAMVGKGCLCPWLCFCCLVQRALFLRCRSSVGFLWFFGFPLPFLLLIAYPSFNPVVFHLFSSF